MNDRILELAKEASINCVVPTDGTLEFTDKGDIEHLKKFAELIIRECALTLESITVPVSDSFEDFDNGYNRGLLFGSDVIKKYFGVEE